MFFNTKKRTVYSPENPSLTELYNVLKKYAHVNGNSRMFEDLVDAYEKLDFDLDDGIYEEEKNHQRQLVANKKTYLHLV